MCNHNCSLKYSTKCCIKKVCWFCYSATNPGKNHISCYECGIHICNVSCKPNYVNILRNRESFCDECYKDFHSKYVPVKDIDLFF